MSFLFGSAPKAAQPFRSSGYEQQGQTLNDLFMGQVMGANPQLQGGIQSQLDSLMNQRASLQQSPNAGGLLTDRQKSGFDPIGASGQQLTDLNNQIAGLEGQLSQGQAFQSQLDQIPQLNFQARDPFQFQSTGFDPSTAVGNAYAPQIAAAEASLARQGELQRGQINEDLNRRGLLTAGATTEALTDQRANEQFALSQMANQFAAQQAQQQLGAQQFGSQLEQQRQIQQAQELFRQAGATDQQALQMANQALQAQGFQNQLQRQPQEDLLRLYQLSTGGTPASQGSQGLFGALAPIAGAAIGSAIMPGLGTAIGGSLGGAFGGG